jgi:signal transduction histidine kinase
MNRPFVIWSVFGGALLLLLSAMFAVSITAVRLDRAQAEAQRQAEFEEKVRLALWRMDSTLAPLILQESSRPYFTYNSFFPADRAYDKMFGPPSGKEVLLPSPLLTQTSSNVLLHFQYGPDGILTSPQVPVAARQKLAEAHVDVQQIELASRRLTELQHLIKPDALAVACATTLSEPVPMTLGLIAPQIANAQVQQRADPVQLGQQQQVVLNQVELQARAQNYKKSAEGNNYINAMVPRGDVAEGMVKPIWFGDALVLARRVSVEGRQYIQGCWLDWPAIRSGLLDSINDLLPNAQLQALRGTATDPQARMLASLPLRLIPGPAPKSSVPDRLAPIHRGKVVNSQLSFAASPMKIALAVSWLCMLLAAAAVAVLLHGAVSLSERRGAFVSAVTHELRTPLTTFKMYSEMLAEGMVQDEEKKRSYLNTLCSEANRLSHLVENVLAYARLERGSARSRVESLSLVQLIDRVKPRLAQRAEHAGMSLVVDGSEEAVQSVVHVDVAAVEQILFNLVDNACKYAAPNASEKIIHLEAVPNPKSAMLRVRDHGQGISEQGARRLFKPFSKSAHEAAHTAPGVGLGLALCRRLSRSMGGDLQLDHLITNGACFVLSLPLSDATRPACIA